VLRFRVLEVPVLLPSNSWGEESNALDDLGDVLLTDPTAVASSVDEETVEDASGPALVALVALVDSVGRTDAGTGLIGGIEDIKAMCIST
jgi:hypothetical protein